MPGETNYNLHLTWEWRVDESLKFDVWQLNNLAHYHHISVVLSFLCKLNPYFVRKCIGTDSTEIQAVYQAYSKAMRSLPCISMCVPVVQTSTFLLDAPLLVPTSMWYCTFGEKSVTSSMAEGTSWLLCLYCYNLPMHGHRIVHLLDVKNDYRKLHGQRILIKNLMEWSVQLSLTRTIFHPSRTVLQVPVECNLSFVRRIQ
jgi:hypothetical protein